jgi:type II secretory pathway pseudopilin PulG
MHKRRHRRSQSGQNLIEMLFAVSISGYLAVILGTSLAQTLATTVKTENRLKGQDIASELIDRVRQCPYSQLTPPVATMSYVYNVKVYAGTGPTDDGITLNGALPFQSVPLLIDETQGLTWNIAATSNYLKGPSPNGYATATVVLTPNTSANDAINVTTTVNWIETNATQQFTTVTVISRNGIHG